MFYTYPDITVLTNVEIDIYSLIPKVADKSIIIQNKSSNDSLYIRTISTSVPTSGINLRANASVVVNNDPAHDIFIKNAGYGAAVLSITQIPKELTTAQLNQLQSWTQQQLDLVDIQADDNTARIIALENGSNGGDFQEQIDELSEEIEATSTNMSIALDFKLDKTSVVDSLGSTDTTKPLSANKGRELLDMIVDSQGDVNQLSTNINLKLDKTSVVDSLIITDNTKALSANRGNELFVMVVSAQGLLSEHEYKVNTLIDEVDVLETDNTTNKTNITSNGTAIGLIQSAATALTTRVSNAESTISTLQSSVASNTSEINTLSPQVSTNTSAVAGLNTRLTTAEGNITTNTTSIGTINSTLTTKLNINAIIDNLTSTSIVAPLSANQGKVLQDTKQANLVSGTNIKTINGTTILGSGNISTTTPDATTTVKGIVQLAGDLGGTSAAPSVLKVNGVGVSGTPTYASVLVATSSNTAVWQGGLSNAGRVSCYGTISQNATSSFSTVTAGSAMTVTGNTSLYTGSSTGITVAQAGTYKVTVTAYNQTNPSISAENTIAVDSVATGAIYSTSCAPGLLTGNDKNNVTFTELVTATAGQLISVQIRSSSTTTLANGYTMIVEKLS